MNKVDRLYAAFFAGLVVVATALGLGLNTLVQMLLNMFYAALRTAGLM